MKSNELLDKKVIRRNNEASLIIEKDMSVQDELVEYLKYILEISETKIPEIVGIFNDYSSKIEME